MRTRNGKLVTAEEAVAFDNGMNFAFGKPAWTGWMLEHPKIGLFKGPPANTASQCWIDAATWDIVQSNVDPKIAREYVAEWKAKLKKEGWRAVQVAIRVY